MSKLNGWIGIHFFLKTLTCLRGLSETVDNRIVIDFIKDVRCYILP